MRISDWSSDVCSSDLRNLWTFGLTSGQHVENDRIRVGFAHSANDRTGLAVAVTASLEDLASAGEDHGFQVNRGRRIGAPRSEERRVGKSVSVRVAPGGRRIIKKKH